MSRLTSDAGGGSGRQLDAAGYGATARMSADI